MFYDVPQPNGISFQDPATPIAEAIIDLHHSIFAIILVISIFVVYMLGTLLKRWHRGWEKPSLKSMEINGQYLQTVNLVHSSTLETVWTIIPSIILMVIAVPSFALLYAMDEILDPEYTQKVIGYQWYWRYESGQVLPTSKEPFDMNNYDLEALGFTDRGYGFDTYMRPYSDLLEAEAQEGFKGGFRLLEPDANVILPAETQIRIIVTSADVLHAWSVNSLGVKVDAVPGRLNQLAVYIKRPGYFFGQCSELCGTNHAFMPIGVRGIQKDRFYDSDVLMYQLKPNHSHTSQTTYPEWIFPGQPVRIYETVAFDDMVDWIEDMAEYEEKVGSLL